ncbi:BrxA/BrxB family bacilliredoxin [Lacibacter luteus]|uniref:BrxA/BrxB family bacilliredoxin n=1 Tax=Lacibacter luteus TaxID=2508719 RepID=A0A4Q1CPH4_9BACT|nr:BrxA/BrxB family bacilliredoxin [Lacibacter luteus]RXK62685.1 BrxA/BrxB family bacilliredoxin [Lacibacter luteus]
MAMISLDSLMGNQGPSYPEQIAAPYRKELVDAGFEQMMSVEDVEKVLAGNPGKTVLLVLNSVCGCSARVSRPGALLSFFNHVVPDVKATLFAGMEKEAVAHFRANYLNGITPSSPNVLLLKDGQVLLHLQRHQIETTDAGTIADALITAYNEYCTKQTTEAEREELRSYFKNLYQVDPLATQE